jgi:hypothetical protein
MTDNDIIDYDKIGKRLFKYTVRFRVTGTDHDGYCTDAEGEPIQERLHEEKVTLNFKAFKLSEFDYVNDGCTPSTTHGSGYCSGCSQTYKAIEIVDFQVVDIK